MARPRALCAALGAAVFVSATNAMADEPGSYVKPMQLCDAISLAPVVLSAAVVVGQVALDVYAHADTFFAHEGDIALGAGALTLTGYVACGPATHIAHGRLDRAAASLALRVGLPASAVALTAGLTAAGNGWPDVGTAVGSVAIIGAFTSALLIDYSLAVAPAVSATPGGVVAGVRVAW